MRAMSDMKKSDRTKQRLIEAATAFAPDIDFAVNFANQYIPANSPTGGGQMILPYGSDETAVVRQDLLVQVPQANATWAETAVHVYRNVDIAVAVNTAKGLLTPVVRRCHEKSIVAIARPCVWP